MEINESAPGNPHVGRQRYSAKGVALHKAALKGDWKAAEKLLTDDPSLVNASITQGGETALHIVSLEGHFLCASKLLEMEDIDVKIVNRKGSTALCFAAAAGNLKIVELMVSKYSDLATIRGPNGVTPLYMAAQQGHTHIADHLFGPSNLESWTTEDRIALLTTTIDSELYGFARRIVQQYEELALVEDGNGETPLQVLARKPLVFSGSNNASQGLWRRIITSIILTCKKVMTDDDDDDIRAPRCDAYRLLDFLWNTVISQRDVETAGLTENTTKLFLTAAESGNVEFLLELIRRYPDFLYKINESNHSIFHIAVLHRYVEVFNLVYELRGSKDLMAAFEDKNDNNILHLAAKLGPRNQLNLLPGAALQMQREVLWYKEVEKIVRPSYRNKKNSSGQRPWDLFLLEHEDLMKQGEKMMKQTAKACMLVAILIATVVFTVAFTVPGGYDSQSGAPILRGNKLFQVLPFSEAVATLSSVMSLLVFLFIMTARYSPKDFVNMLPFWMVGGVVSLFVSIVAMMVTMCTCLLLYEHGIMIITGLTVMFVAAPIMFVVLKYPLVVTILRSTFGSKLLFRSSNQLVS